MNSVSQDVAQQTAETEPAVISPEVERLAKLSPRPTTIAQTGLSLTFLADLMGKHLASAGVLTTSELIDRLALAGPIVNQILNFMRAEARVEVRSRLGLDAELRYGLTDKGRLEANDAMNRDGYVGPAPVPLADYVALARRQSVHRTKVTRQAVHEAFTGIVITDELLDRLGPALRSEEHTSELQSQSNLVCRLLLEKKKKEHMIHPLTKVNDTVPTIHTRRSVSCRRFHNTHTAVRSYYAVSTQSLNHAQSRRVQDRG